MKLRHDQRGVTLVELAVVISVVSLLSTLAIGFVTQARVSARDTIRIQDLQAVQRALSFYYDDHNQYPQTLANPGNPDSGHVWYGTCAAASCHGSWGVSTEEWVPEIDGEFISHLPLDPAENDCNRCYLYRSDGQDYKILAHRPENINNRALEGFVDPRRDGGSDSCLVDGTVLDDAWSWAVFSSGGRCW